MILIFIAKLWYLSVIFIILFFVNWWYFGTPYFVIISMSFVIPSSFYHRIGQLFWSSYHFPMEFHESKTKKMKSSLVNLKPQLNLNQLTLSLPTSHMCDAPVCNHRPDVTYMWRRFSDFQLLFYQSSPYQTIWIFYGGLGTPNCFIIFVGPNQCYQVLKKIIFYWKCDKIFQRINGVVRLW